MPSRSRTASATPPRRAVLVLLGLAAVAFLTGAAGESGSPKPAPKVQTTTDSFASGDKKITAEWFRPPGKGPHPAILLVHESAGMKLLPAAVVRHYGKLLAKEGYVVLIVHYFNRTGQEAVDPRQPDEIRKHFPAWQDTLRDAFRLLARDPGVEPRRIGMLGLSLGSYLALSLAMDKDLGVAAVANLFGGLPDELWKDLKYLPPVLVIGGRKDKLVPADKCFAIRDWCKNNGVVCECRVFEDQDHLFAGDVKKHLNFANPLDVLQKSKDIQESQRRVFAFFARHLRAEQPK